MLFIYPSKSFLNDAGVCLERGEDIEIVVENKRKIKMLTNHLPLLTSDTNKERGFVKTFFRQFMLMDFLAVYGKALTIGNYTIDYHLNDKLHIYLKKTQFKPPTN